MKLTFLGAARTVTGSCYLLETNGKKLLVDCGMFQGSKLVRDFNNRPFAFAPGEIDAMLLTHAHIDHSGLIPKLVKEGYGGPVYCTQGTLDLCQILLPDSAHIQESEAEFANRKGMRAGKKQVDPLYTLDEASAALKHFRPRDFDETFEVLPGIAARFRVAGHILGSAFIELKVEEGGRVTRFIFTGDVGQPDQPILDDPDHLPAADFIITESTYGNREHKKYDKEEELAEIINATAAKGGNVVFPAFAVGRTQVLLYYIQRLTEAGRIPELPIYIDSPMAVKATNITMNRKEEFDEEAQAILANQGSLYRLPNLHFTATASESKLINTMEGSKIILSASGMADAGRILHHLKHNLWRKECAVVFAGYQAEGSMGRRLVDGVKQVRIMGETIKVAATIYNMSGFSAHADKNQLMEWFGRLPQKPKAFFVTHGEIEASTELARQLQFKLGTAAYIPQYADSASISGSEFTITAAEVVSEVPEVAELRDYLRSLENDYLSQRARLEQLVVRDSGKASMFKKRLQKLKKSIDDLLESV